MADKSFDIISKVDNQSLKNAINQAIKEIKQRFDFKGTKSDIKLDGDKITVVSDDSFKIKRVMDVFKNKLIGVVKDIKTLKMKVQAQVQGDQLRVSAKKIDDLRTLMKLLEEKKYDFNIEFANFR